MLSFLLNLIIVIGTFLTLFYVMFIGRSSDDRFHCFRYFTTDSNLLSGISCLLYLLFGINKEVLPLSLQLMKYAGCISVMLTFFTVILFLGPSEGNLKMFYEKDGFFFHLAGPLLALLSFCFFDRGMSFSIRWIPIGLLPVFLYALLYLNMVVFVGKEKGGWPDFYGFLKGGSWKFMFTVMLLASLLLSFLVYGLMFLFGA